MYGLLVLVDVCLLLFGEMFLDVLSGVGRGGGGVGGRGWAEMFSCPSK